MKGGDPGVHTARKSMLRMATRRITHTISHGITNSLVPNKTN